MLRFLVGASVYLALVFPASGTVNCYYGWTQDGDANPEDDWSGKTCDGDKDINGCMGAYCDTTTSICFKVRYEGDDEFLSLYGCADDFNAPTNEGSWIPGGYSVKDIDLSQLNGVDDECEEVESPTVPELPTDGVGLGSDVTANYCTCVISECNGAHEARAATLVVSILAFALLVLM